MLDGTIYVLYCSTTSITLLSKGTVHSFYARCVCIKSNRPDLTFGIYVSPLNISFRTVQVDTVSRGSTGYLNFTSHFKKFEGAGGFNCTFLNVSNLTEGVNGSSVRL